MDEPSVEAGEPEERADIGEVGWSLPVLDYLDLLWLHAYPAASDDEAQVRGLCLVEFALPGVQV